MTNCIILVGIPGCGKSTIAQDLAVKYNAKIFSSDDYRKDILGDERDQSENSIVFEKLHKDICACLEGGGSVILDACSTTSKRRRQTLEIVKKYNCKKIAYVLRTDIDTCITRDKSRERGVGKWVIHKFISGYDIPCYNEGFDEIILDGINEVPTPNFEERDKLFLIMQNFEQHNPHHIYNLFEHSKRLSDQYDKGSVEWEAGYFHDVGKLYTQTFDENNVAHYYAHSNWSAYYMLTHLDLFNLKTIDDILICLFIINNHMKVRDVLRNEKTIEKYKRMWGVELFNREVKFMECDNIATGTSDK